MAGDAAISPLISSSTRPYASELGSSQTQRPKVTSHSSLPRGLWTPLLFEQGNVTGAHGSGSEDRIA
ncbi:hypothetical protein LTR95_010878, partial [Oleoguttula sp. CCFEE 5521]